MSTQIYCEHGRDELECHECRGTRDLEAALPDSRRAGEKQAEAVIEAALSLNEKERAVIKAAREQKRLYDKDGLLFEYRRACEKTNVSVAALDEALREGG